MNEREASRKWLAQEVEELLGVGSVGLYEFMQLLNGDEFDLSEADRKAVAVAVLRQIIESGRAKLYEIKWPKDEVLSGPFGVEFIDTLSETFPVAPAECYLALLP
ncbi:MAG TPA: hypothetical protein VGH89_31675 [Pseudonocardia sp.]|jgi:hypothetical protein